MGLTNLRLLAARISVADGPDSEIDLAIATQIEGLSATVTVGDGIITERRTIPARIPAYTMALDQTIRLVERKLPGWWWSLGKCSVSDDARLCPDFNNPKHGSKWRTAIGHFEPGSAWDGGFDIDRRPAGNVPLALLEALLDALIALEERGVSLPLPAPDREARG